MIALYSRVSTAEQASEGYSITEQQDRLKSYCDSRGWKRYKHFVDGGFSGANLDRPALQEMIEGIEAGTIDKVIVYKLDRLSRSQKDTLELIEDIFIPHKVDFISMSENLDTSSAFGMAMVGMLSCFSQLEKSAIKERMAIGRVGRAKEGKWHGGHFYPIGYNLVNGELIVNEFEAMQVKECFRLYLEGYSLADIARTLNSKGWTHKWGQWTFHRVRFVLRNPVYIGLITHKGEKYQGIHEKLVCEADFNAVQEIIKKNYLPKHTCTDSYLIGKVYCARCGAKYAYQYCNRHGNLYNYYSCYSRCKANRKMVKNPNCKNDNYKAPELDKIVLDEMRKLTLEDLHERPVKESDKLKPLKKELEKIDKQRERLMDLYTIGDFSIEELQNKVLPLTEKRNLLKSQIEEFLEEPKDNMEELKKAVSSISDILDNGDFFQIRQLIDILINRIEIDGEDITIHWDFY